MEIKEVIFEPSSGEQLFDCTAQVLEYAVVNKVNASFTHNEGKIHSELLRTV